MEGDPGETLPRGEDKLAAAYAALGIAPATSEHRPVFTVQEAQELRGAIAGLHTKNLFLKDKGGRYFLVTLPEDAAVDLKTIHTAIGARGRVSFGSPEALARMLGVAPGSVTPLGLLNDDAGAVSCVFHPRLGEADVINVHPLRNTATVSLRRADLFEILRRSGHEPAVVELPTPAAPA